MSKEDASVDEAERQKALDILWRLQTGEGVDDDVSDTEDISDLDAQPPREATLDDYTPEQLLGLLTLREREQFTSLLREPTKAAAMYFTEGEQPSQLWWQRPTMHTPWLPSQASMYTTCLQHMSRTYATKLDLRFNMALLLLAYTYILRHLHISSLAECLPRDGVTTWHDDEGPPPLEEDTPDVHRLLPMAPTSTEGPEVATVVSLFESLAPCLFPATEKERRLCLASAEEAGLYFAQLVQRVDATTYYTSPLLLSLWDDLVPLFAPHRVQETMSTPTHAHMPVVWACADLHTYLSTQAPSSRRLHNALKKLEYYACSTQPGGATDAATLASAIEAARTTLTEDVAAYQRTEQVAHANHMLSSMAWPVNQRPRRIDVLRESHIRSAASTLNT